MPIITLTTDFGQGDGFVGTMKGVILGINPRAALVDVTHQIPPGDVRAGAFALANSCRFFPKGTVHLAVVDPGVGSRRRAIVIRTSQYCFVGPDNGLLSWAARHQRVLAVRSLDNEEFFLHPVSHTFHGRDVFAPAAAHISLGLPLSRMGPKLDSYIKLDWPAARFEKGELHGEVLYVDQFGNAITNIETSLLANRRLPECSVFRGGRRLCPLKDHYQAVPPGLPVAVPGSSGFLEIAVNGGNAASKLRLRVGARIAVRHRAAAR